MKHRRYLIVGRPRGTRIWLRIGEKVEPSPRLLFWIPKLDNIAGGLAVCAKQKPDWEFKAERFD